MSLSFSIVNDERVNQIVNKFERTLSDCPTDARPRQRITTEFKENGIFIFITTSFRFPVATEEIK